MYMAGNGLDSVREDKGEIYMHSLEREPGGAQLANRKSHGCWRVRKLLPSRAWSFTGE